MTLLHYTAGSPAAIAEAGFNLADVSSVSQLNALPSGMKGLVWVGRNVGADATFRSFIAPFANNPKLFGFRLGDEPDITGKYTSKLQIQPAQYKAETDFIKATCPGAKTFVVLMDMGSYESPVIMGITPNYTGYTPANTGIDYFGLDPYPVRGDLFDINYIDRMVTAAVKGGIPIANVIPVHQAFGGGNYSASHGNYKLPTVAQAQAMFERWKALVPNPAFDYAWTWQSKEGIACIGGATAPELALREAFRVHNAAVAPAPAPVLTLNGKPATQTDIDALVAAASKSAATIAQIKGLVNI